MDDVMLPLLLPEESSVGEFYKFPDIPIYRPPYDTLNPSEYDYKYENMSEFDPMKPADYGNLTIQEDMFCGATTILVWGAGIALGYILADKFTTMLR